MARTAEKQLVTEREAARLIGFSVSFLRDSRCNGMRGSRTPAPPYYQFGRTIRYAVDELEDWLKEHRREG